MANESGNVSALVNRVETGHVHAATFAGSRFCPHCAQCRYPITADCVHHHSVNRKRFVSYRGRSVVAVKSLPLPNCSCLARIRCKVKTGGNDWGSTATEVWVVADVARVRETIARCRQDPAARDALGEEFVHAYATFSTGNTPDYWNRYLTWVVVQTLAVERWPDLPYSLRNAAAVVLRFLNETEEETGDKGVLGRWRRPRSMRDAVPRVTATMQLLATLGGAAAESRADALSPGVDPTYTEEGALYFDDAECQEVLASLPLLRAFFIDAPYGPQFHFLGRATTWVVPRFARCVDAAEPFSRRHRNGIYPCTKRTRASFRTLGAVTRCRGSGCHGGHDVRARDCGFRFSVADREGQVNGKGATPTE